MEDGFDSRRRYNKQKLRAFASEFFVFISARAQGLSPNLEVKQKALLEEKKRIEEAIAYIDWKQGFYDDVLSGKIKYFSNLIAVEE